MKYLKLIVAVIVVAMIVGVGVMLYKNSPDQGTKEEVTITEKDLSGIAMRKTEKKVFDKLSNVEITTKLMDIFILVT